ncbi:nickel pincer cofactor biosynthesis protein LarC [Halobacteriales archaeon SW_6_65_46]|nr:MAG: nickel pincer cofactor biosynthesis protein LarC [Halobacteriales archaeon SW_6_65_46]
MQTLAFDGQTGAAGDMLLAALLAAGADPDALVPVTDALPVEYRLDRRDEHGITATTVDVLLTDEIDEDGEEAGGAGSDESLPSLDKTGRNGHAHGDGDEAGHTHDDHGDHAHGPDGHTHAEGHGVTRTYPEVVELVESMALGERAEAIALGAFRRLGAAEATVHDTDLETTAFHEVGADDAVADIVGVALLVADLDPERIVTTPVSAGGGEVRMAHGTYPVPAPAVVEIASEADWELRGGPVDEELLTPTGAAVLAELADGVDSLPPMQVGASGYGAGARSLADRPNVVRAVVGAADEGLVRDEIRVLETNLDDASPELLGSLQRSLKEAGARDVSVVPVTMKKGRPGHLVKVIVRPPDVQAVARRLAEETGTLGVRETGAGHRWIATRAFETAEIEIDGETFGVSVKIASDGDGTVYDVSAEFDDADAVAERTGLSVREVMRRAEAQIR